jgi:membrane-associated protease RseP (regulator of RpoE activity)
MVHLVGFALLMTLIVLVSINDIQRLISGSSPLG